ncbi:MAG: helix-turn-helix domain-containing protein [Myxacorys californica WJT36-NPBG1]|jgi:transcriptional regulator with XRE-family HTH domain|nr:helix-turn-helix domain-containing protein [Myxacorys californica WJT36-NPBG1]
MAVISAKRNSEGTEQPTLVDLVRETRQRLQLSQAKFATKLGVSFQSVNRWENGRTKPVPIASLHGYVLALKQVEQLLHQMGDSGKGLLAKYFSQQGRRRYD